MMTSETLRVLKSFAVRQWDWVLFSSVIAASLAASFILVQTPYVALP